MVAMEAFPAPLADTLAADETFDAAVRRHGSELFGLAIAITGNRHDAEDAYQAALEQAWVRWDSLRDPTSRRSWLASICARTALRTRERRHRWGRRHVDLGLAADLGRMMPWDRGMGEALGTLTARQRAVVALHYGHGYALDEVASLLGARPGTVRSHLHRALETLRRRLGDAAD